MALYISAIKPTTLKSSLSSTASSLVVNSFKDRHDEAVTLATFGEWLTVVVKNGDQWECIKCDGVTNNANGSTTLTVATSGRKMLPVSPFTGSSTGFDFAAGSDVIVTNDPYIMSKFGNLENAQTWNEIQTFAALPSTTAGNPVLATDLARKAYVDSVVAGIATTINVIVPGTAGETVAAGNLIYFDDTENEWMKCDADTAATVENALLGIAQGAGVNGGSISGGVLLRGLDANQTGLTAAALYYASNTAGGISASAGTKEVTVGFSYSTTQLYFNPRFNQQLTEDQQDALAGTQGTPSASNLFSTAGGEQRGTPIYAASVVGTDSYAITVTPTVSSYSAGMKFRFLADVANTGAATLAVGSGAAKTIKKLHDQDLATGDIEANQIVEVAYDAVADTWQMLSQTATAAPTVDYQAFTASGTWTKPTGLTGNELVIVHAWGGGGGGGGGTGGGAGGGGGGGGFTEARFRASDLGSTETVTIGAGGAGGASGDNEGTVGGDTTLGSLVTAKGGPFGRKHSVQTGGVGGAGFGGIYAGGTAGAASGGTGAQSVWGGGGGGGGNSGAGGAGAAAYFGGGGGGGGAHTSGAGGAGGAAHTGYGGAGGAGGTQGAGASATTLAGGGGGAASASAGGDGFRGEVRVWTIK